MNELQLSLALLGGVVVVLIFAYNKWQEWRHRKVAEKMFAHEHDDVLMGKQVREALDSTESVRAENVASSRFDVMGERREPGLAETDLRETRQEPTLGGFAPEVEFANVNPPLAETDEPAEGETPAEQAPAEEIQAASPARFEDQPTSLEETPPWSATAAGLAEPDIVDVEPIQRAETAATDPNQPVPVNLLNPACDTVIRFELLSPMKAADLLQMGLDAFNRTEMPVYWLGLDSAGQWVPLAADQSDAFCHVRLVMQLATRRGPVSEPAVNLFVATAAEIAVALNAVMDVSDTDTALDRAREIDHFCADVDLQIGLNLVGLSPFLGTKIRALAEAAGMALNWQGAYEMRDDLDRPLFELSNQEVPPFAADTLKTMRTHALTFALDVPRVPNGGHVYDHMLRLAKQFADALQATIVDDRRQPLNAEQLNSIRELYVVKPQADMASRGIVAGSPLALRLFS